MQHINFSATFQVMEHYMSFYNTKPLTRYKKKENKLIEVPILLKAAHFQLMFTIVKMYSAQLNKGFQMQIDGTLPPFLTNNEAMATKFKCSSRTIRRYIKLLCHVGILEKIFRGSIHDFKLTIRPDLLRFAYEVDPKTIKKEIDQAELNELRDNVLQKATLTECPYKDSGTINKKLIDKVENPAKKIPVKPNIPAGFSDKNHDSGNTKRQAKTMPEKIPAKNEAKRQVGVAISSGENFSAAKFAAPLASIFSIVQNLWNLALTSIYMRIEYLTPAEIEYAYLYFFKQFENVKESDYQKIYNDLKIRLYMVNAWLKKSPDRYIPIPSKYFSPDNPNGFDNTVSWRDRMQETTASVEVFRKLHHKKRSTYEDYLKKHAAMMELGEAFIKSNSFNNDQFRQKFLTPNH
ncbi:MAG: hypothetical protein IT215_00575 [Chitinophagaceae bacterium]|nr:hypothetical protein [Chitinophagaceae bacterium]